MQTIRLSDALAVMEAHDHYKKPIPFSISVFSADEKRQEAGEFIEYHNCILSKFVKALPRHLKDSKTSLGTAKLPMHWKNSTRNIFLLDTQEIKKIHIRLIYSINDKIMTF